MAIFAPAESLPSPATLVQDGVEAYEDGREGVDDEDHGYLFQLQQVDSQNLDSSDHLNI